jgi:hypothetical protein
MGTFERDADAADEVRPGEAGDVEAAGETTAVAALGNDGSEEKPVGADTLVEVEGDPKPAKADGS